MALDSEEILTKLDKRVKDFSDIIVQKVVDENLMICHLKGKGFVNSGKFVDNNSNEPQIVVGKSTKNGAVGIGQSVVIGQVSYKVVGINNVADFHFVNTASVKAEKFGEVKFIANKQVTSTNIKGFNNVLTKAFATEVVNPPLKDFIEQMNDSKMIVLICCMFLVLFADAMYLMSYEIKKRGNRIKAYIVCGLKKNRIIVTYFLEVFLYLTLQFFVALAIFYMFFPIIKEGVLGFQFLDVMYSFVTYMLLNSIIIYPLISKFINTVARGIKNV
ncbi:MAG: hypothetical protein RR374_02630 [Clostridia bacterium]